MNPEIDIRTGDALETLKTIEADSVQCCITSPPYWGLRDYGVDGQIGLEDAFDDYVRGLTSVFDEVRKVLRPDGTLWLNMGDGYAAIGRGGGGAFMDERRAGAWQHRRELTGWRSTPAGMKQKDLIGQPWALAFALRAAGWYLRADIIWHKPNAMPESVTDRPTKSHEYIFLMSKSPRYYYDADAINEPAVQAGRILTPYSASSPTGADMYNALANNHVVGDFRNARDVWSIPTENYPEAHFATFPQAVVKKCVLAGTKYDDLVLDPFCGSGTVGLVCKNLRRRFLGIELNPDYVDLAHRRIRTAQPIFPEMA